MHRSDLDGNLYYLSKEGNTLVPMIYVDDIFIIWSCNQLITWIKMFLHKQINMKDLGPIQRYLGVSFESNPCGTFIYQWDYAKSILLDFNMANCKPTPTQLPEGTVLGIDMQSFPIGANYYCKFVGKFIFLTVTKLNLARAINHVSNYMANPLVAHLNAIKHILWYMQGTYDYGLTYQSGRPTVITSSTDADYINCVERICSIWAYIFTIGGGPVSWQSTRQPIIFQSSIESNTEHLVAEFKRQFGSNIQY